MSFNKQEVLLFVGLYVHILLSSTTTYTKIFAHFLNTHCVCNTNLGGIQFQIPKYVQVSGLWFCQWRSHVIEYFRKPYQIRMPNVGIVHSWQPWLQPPFSTSPFRWQHPGHSGWSGIKSSQKLVALTLSFLLLRLIKYNLQIYNNKNPTIIIIIINY